MNLNSVSKRALEQPRATDHPPTVLNRNAKPLPAKNQTCQHLATLSTSSWSPSIAAPVLLANKYFIWGSEGKITLWTHRQLASAYSSRQKDALTPAFVLDVNAASTQWIQISPSTLPDHPMELLCLTSAGVFFQVQVQEVPTVQLKIRNSWNTDRSGTASFCQTVSGLVVVGYQNGIIEGWRKEKRVWMGNFQSYAHPTSLVSLKTTTTKEYVVVALEGRDRLPTSASVEVICVSSIPEMPGSETFVALEDFWVLSDDPAVTDAAAISEAYKHQTSQSFETHWIPSHGSNVVTILPGPNDQGAQVLVELADGSVVFLETNHDTTTDELRWQVHEKTIGGQVLLSFPSIGRGIVTVHGQRYAACSLRGGNVYLFPLLDGGSDPELAEQIRSCHYPDDISRDSTIHHLQSFIAGDLDLFLVTKESVIVPLFFFCWPGGIVDVYCAHLLPEPQETLKDLFDMIENGTVKDLSHLLQALTNDPDNLLADPLWAKAQAESLANGDMSTVTVSDLESTKLTNFTRLLLTLADPSKPLPVNLD
jgi:hypothetical protein